MGIDSPSVACRESRRERVCIARRGRSAIRRGRVGRCLQHAAIVLAKEIFSPALSSIGSAVESELAGDAAADLRTVVQAALSDIDTEGRSILIAWLFVVPGSAGSTFV